MNNPWNKIIDAIKEMGRSPEEDMPSCPTIAAAENHARFCMVINRSLPDSVIPHGGDIVFEWTHADGSTEIHTVCATVKITRLKAKK